MPVEWFIVAFLLCLLFTAARLSIYRFSGEQIRGESKNWEPRSSSFYSPMQRLLSPPDLAFVAAACGMNSQAVRNLNADRRRIFRQYLQCLSVDFSQISSALRVIMVDSDSSRSDLASALFRARVTFVLSIAILEFRLALHSLGMRNLSITGEALTGALSQMQQRFDQLSAVPRLSAV